MPDHKSKPKRVVVLGAGASRGVSYALEAKYPSPLDTDFFDLLQRRLVLAQSSEIRRSIGRVLDRMTTLPFDYWRSMERSFYTLHLRAYLGAKFGSESYEDTDNRVVEDFAVSVQALLRFAHEMNVCKHHQAIFGPLSRRDAIITFNYDLVPERALRESFQKRGAEFGRWLYGLRRKLGEKYGPIVLKLHGSSNWQLGRSELSPIQREWADFDKTYGYQAHEGEGTSFPIFLPFWDKRIEKAPWIKLWKLAHDQLSAATHVIVWGYSLPPTDIKAEQLFVLSLAGKHREPFSLCVVDPAESTRLRWRALFPKALFWEFPSIERFLEHPPAWWRVNR